MGAKGFVAILNVFTILDKLHDKKLYSFFIIFEPDLYFLSILNTFIYIVEADQVSI